MATTYARTEALMQTMNFTLDDLELNRSGQLSSGQRKWLRHMGGRGNEMMGLALGILVVGGGTCAPYVFLKWSPLLGAVLAVLVIVSVPLMMVKMSLSSMLDDEQRQKWGTAAILSNSVLGFLFAISWMGIVFKVMLDSPESAVVQTLLVVGLAFIFIGPLIYVMQRGLQFKEVQVVEGIVKVEERSLGPSLSGWDFQLGVFVNLSLLGVAVMRNMSQGKGIGRTLDDFKVVTSHIVIVGRRKFYTTTEIGKSFIEGMKYRVFYVSGYPLPLLVSGEALDSIDR